MQPRGHVVSNAPVPGGRLFQVPLSLAFICKLSPQEGKKVMRSVRRCILYSLLLEPDIKEQAGSKTWRCAPASCCMSTHASGAGAASGRVQRQGRGGQAAHRSAVGSGLQVGQTGL